MAAAVDVATVATGFVLRAIAGALAIGIEVSTWLGVVVFALTLTDYAMPVVLGGGTNDFIANAVYDAFFRISDNGLGSALAIGLVLFGSTLVGVLLAVLGGRTLGKG
jgi:ABC-type spermidine/putrescine transport system permease subunit I